MILSLTNDPSCCPNAPITECWGVEGYLSGGHGAGYMSRCGCGGGGAPTEDAPWSGWCAASVPYLATSSSLPPPCPPVAAPCHCDQQDGEHSALHHCNYYSFFSTSPHSAGRRSPLCSANIAAHSGNCCRERWGGALFWNSECCGSHVITAVLRFLGSDYHYPQHPRHCNNAIHDNNVTHLIWNCSSGCIEPTQYFYLLSTGNTHFILNSIVIVDDATRRTRTHSSHFSFNSLRSETKWLVD